MRDVVKLEFLSIVTVRITPKKAIPAWTGCLDINIKIKISVIIFTLF